MPTATELSGKARRHLRALGHHLRPVVLVGKDGVSSTLVGATQVALADHELIKVKLGENAAGSREELSKTLATQTGAAQIGLIGRVLLLYKPHPETPKIELPAEKSKPRRTAAPASRTTAPGSRTAAPGSRTAAPGSRTAAPGSRTAAPGRTSAPGRR